MGFFDFFKKVNKVLTITRDSLKESLQEELDEAELTKAKLAVRRAELTHDKLEINQAKKELEKLQIKRKKSNDEQVQKSLINESPVNGKRLRRRSSLRSAQIMPESSKPKSIQELKEEKLKSIEWKKKEKRESLEDQKIIESANKGDAKGLYDLAIMQLHFRAPEDYEGALFDLVEKSANKGYLKAQYFLGLLFEEGYIPSSKLNKDIMITHNFPDSIPKSFIPYTESFYLTLYISDKNQKNIAEAIKWYKKSAEQKYQPAYEKLLTLGIDYNKLTIKTSTLEKYNKTVETKLDNYGVFYIYHMTHYQNIKSILDNDLQSHNNDLVEEHIDNAEVNNRRNRKEPINGKNLHDYVPFYFNPKNPMLYVNKENQEDIVILAFSRKLFLKNKVIFTDGNAAVSTTKFFEDLQDLDKLNWNCLHTTYWNDCRDGKREVMAEILIPNQADINNLIKIYCYNKETKDYILDFNKDLDVEINKKLYF